MRAYIFVDAENHFIRATAVAREIVGSPEAARAISEAIRVTPGIRGFPDSINGKRFGWEPELQFFWDFELLSRDGLLARVGVSISRAIYACACAGDDDKAHGMQVQLRSYGFEPIVVREPKALSKRRATTRDRDRLIEKPKGCDIAIATRMVADAAANLYDCCFLFTSDADFLPAVEAIRNMGKIVWVFGFASALQERSRYLYVPDQFVDLGCYLESAWQEYRSQIEVALHKPAESGTSEG